MPRLLLFITLFCFSLTACKQPEQPKEDLVSAPEEIDPHITKDLQKYLENCDTAKALVVHKDTLLTGKFISSFYKNIKFEPIWSKNGVFDFRFYTMERLIRNARYYFGLVPHDYHYQKIDSLQKHLIDSASGNTDATKLAEIEMLTTDAYFKMANHLHHGRVKIEDSLIVPMWDPNLLKIKLDSMLSTAFQNDQLRQSLESLEPKFEQYFLLKRELRKFIAEHKNDHWCTMPDYKTDSAAYVDSVKLRLTEMKFYDSTLTGSDSLKFAKALRRFQHHYRLTEDGKVGIEMKAAMSYSIEKRIRQIEMTMDRWRTEPRKTEKAYIWVNLPGYNLRVAEADTLVLDSRIICGKPKHQTPLLKSQIHDILVYPYWNVPFKIATKEILPRIKWDTNYLRKQKFDVLNWKNEVVDYRKINWKNFNEHNFVYKFRQGTGEDNSLGVMKFNFYNKYDVYIHDTNAHSLFKRSVRCLSHGCMRIDKYFEFAKFLIRDDSIHIRPDTLMTYIGLQEQKKFNLRKNPTLYVKYFTCEVVDNELKFYPDIYSKDDMMEAILYGDDANIIARSDSDRAEEKSAKGKPDSLKKKIN